jgi:hypothetical protein
MEQPDYVQQFERVAPFNLIVHPGNVRTPGGIVGFIVWQIAADSPAEVLVEQYLNPYEIGTIRLVSSAASQTHFKLLVVNNQTSEVTALVDYENVFQFDEFASDMASSIGHEPNGDFGERTKHVMDHYSVAALVALSREQRVRRLGLRGPVRVIEL